MKKLIFLLLCTSILSAQETTYIHAGRLIDGTSDEPLLEQTIVVSEGKIVSVQPGYVQPEAGDEEDGLAAPARPTGTSGGGSKVINLKDRTVMPGLIDLHVHIEGQSSPTRYLEVFTLEPADVALRATQYCKKTLDAGFTTVRDLGGSGVNVSLRDAINRGYVEGPRIYTAEKAIGTTGGHADPSNGRNTAVTFDAGPDRGVINSVDEAWKAVRARYKNGADCIKITATGGVLSVASDGSGPQFRDEELEAIVAAAKDYNMHTAAHAHGAEGMKRAVLAGITTIEHGTLMTEEVMDLMKERGTYYVPTVSAGRFVAEKAKQPGYFPAIIVPKAISIGSQIQETFGKAYAYGVPIAFGTDSGVGPHGDNAKEFIYMHEAGMPVMEAIQSATSVAATVLGQQDRLGRIAPGYLADIVAVRGNPLEDVELMTKVNFVMKEGEIISRR